MKSYTNLEQSRKLAEILPTESANMWWPYYYDVVSDTGEYDKEPMWHKPVCDPDKALPCWSLTAMLDILPLGINDEFDNCDYELEINMIDKMPRYIRLGDIYHSQFPYDFEKDDLLDNIVESIIWLKEKDLL